MGYWNETCMLTNLPIHDDEPVVAFLIAARPDTELRAEPDDVYAPVSPPIRGRYDDYGGLEEIENEDAVLRALRPTSENESPWLCRTRTGFARQRLTSLPTVLQIAASGQLYVDGAAGDRFPRQERRPVYTAMIRREFFDLAVEWGSKGIHDPRFAAQRALDPLRTAVDRGLVPDKDTQAVGALVAFMRHHRKSFFPTTGAGFQADVDDSDDVIFHRAVLEAAEEMRARNRR